MNMLHKTINNALKTTKTNKDMCLSVYLDSRYVFILIQHHILSKYGNLQ
jgi:ribonuclease HI